MRTGDYFDLHKRLLELYTEEDAHRWMRSEHPQLNGRRPVDSHPLEVEKIIQRLESGAYLLPKQEASTSNK